MSAPRRRSSDVRDPYAGEIRATERIVHVLTAVVIFGVIVALILLIAGVR